MKIRTAKTVILLLAFVLAMSFSAWEGGRADAAMIDVYLGQIRLMVVDDAPSGWAKCNGQQFPIDLQPELYAVLGTRFGGDGVNFFALPKLDSPVPGASYYISVLGQVPESGVLSGITVGQIELFPYAPPGWVPCNGAKLNKQYNTALFSLLGYSFGGEGNAFAIPDLRSAEPDENIHYYMALSGLYPSQGSYAGASGNWSNYVGSINLHPRNETFGGESECDGGLLSAVSYDFHHSVIHYKFGGIGESFAKPDLRGFAPHPALAFYIVTTGVNPY